MTDIPSTYKKAIKAKKDESEFRAELKKFREEYVQDVYRSHPTDTVSYSPANVNPSGDNISYSPAKVAYTDETYSKNLSNLSKKEAEYQMLASNLKTKKGCAESICRF